MIDTTNLCSDMASRWTTAFLIAAIFGGSAFICENRKQAFGLAVLLGSVAFFEIVHAVVKRLLFPDSENLSNFAKDQSKQGYVPCPPDTASTSKNPTKGYVDEVPTRHSDIHQSRSTQTKDAETFHDTMDHFALFSPNIAQALKKNASTKTKKKKEKRAMAIRRAKQSMAEDKIKVEANMKRKAATMHRALSPTTRHEPYQ